MADNKSLDRATKYLTSVVEFCSQYRMGEKLKLRPTRHQRLLAGQENVAVASSLPLRLRS